MSRIYDALKLAETGQPAALAQLIDDEHTHASALSPELFPEAGESFAEEGGPVLVRADFDPGDDQWQAETAEVGEAPVALPDPPAATVLSIPPGMPIFPFDGTEPRAAEQYRILRTNLVQHELKPRVIAVSSPAPGDGKTISAINIAGILAMKGDATVLLIDADLRQCSVANALGLAGTRGLAEVVRGDCTPDQAVIPVGQLPGLQVLCSGNVQGNPAELLDSPVFRSLVADARNRFSYVVLDTPPMTAVTDFKLVQQVCDGVLVVVRPDYTNRAVFADAMKAQQKDKLLGTVINAVDDWFLWRSKEAYRYAAPGAAKKSYFGRKSIIRTQQPS